MSVEHNFLKIDNLPPQIGIMEWVSPLCIMLSVLAS
jgi:hypothetical protein